MHRFQLCKEVVLGKTGFLDKLQRDERAEAMNGAHDDLSALS